MPIHSVGKSLLAVTLAGLILPGCATTGGSATDDQQRTVTEGAVVGAVLGGLIGAAVSDNKGVGALVGALGGGAIGAAIGKTVAERKAQYADEEDFLIAEIELNQEFIAEADAQNRELYQEIARLDQESQRLAREYRAGKVSRDALVSQKANLEKQLAKAKQVKSLSDKQLADANQVYGETRQKRGSQDKYTQQLASNVEKLKATQQQSNQNVTSLQRVYDNMSI